MSAEKLKIEVLLAAIDKATRPFKAITTGSNETAKALKAAKDQLKQLNEAQGRVDTWRKLDKDLAIVRNSMSGAQERIKALKNEIAQAGEPTRAMSRSLKEAQEAASNLKGRYNGLIERQQRLRTEMSDAGIDTRNLAAHQRDLAKSIATATAAVDKQATAFKAERDRINQLTAAKDRYDKSMALHGKVTQAGKMTVAAGITSALPVVAAVRQYTAFEDAMLGVARQVDGARDANGKLTATYYEMGVAIKAMSERLPMASTEIAAIVEAGARMGIQGKQNLLAYAETVAVMSTAFDLPVDRVGEDMAKVAALYKVPIASIKDLGDTINWLDDNALAKGGDIIDVMKRIGGTADFLKMPYREAAALGSTFLSLGANAEVAGSASNAMMRELSVAAMQGKRFQGGLKMLGLDAKNLQKAMSKDATGTIISVLEAIKKLPEEQRLEAATRMFGKEFGDDAAKLAANLDEYRRQLELVNAAKAKGSMDREMAARNANLSSSYKEMINTISNLASDLGASLKPALTDIMTATTGVLQSVRGWIKDHPELSAALMKGAAIIAVLVTGLGALVFAVGAVMAPIALMRFGMAMLGGTSFGLVGRLLGLLNPIGKVMMAFSAGYAIGSWLNGLLDTLASKIAGYNTSLGGLIFDVIQMFKKGDWASIGGFVVRGIEAGLDVLTGGLYSRIKNIASSMVTAARSALGIKSPSRVFAQIGSYTMEGLGQGIDSARNGPISSIIDATRRVTAAGAGLLLGGVAFAGGPGLDTRPPLTGGGLGGSAAPMAVTINIYGYPGQATDDIQRQVEAALANIDNNRQARARSRFTDRE